MVAVPGRRTDSHTRTHTQPLQTPFIVFGAPSAFLLVPSGCLHDCSGLCPSEDTLIPPIHPPPKVYVISPGECFIFLRRGGAETSALPPT